MISSPPSTLDPNPAPYTPPPQEFQENPTDYFFVFPHHLFPTMWAQCQHAARTRYDNIISVGGSLTGVALKQRRLVFLTSGICTAAAALMLPSITDGTALVCVAGFSLLWGQLFLRALFLCSVPDAAVLVTLYGSTFFLMVSDLVSHTVYVSLWPVLLVLLNFMFTLPTGKFHSSLVFLLSVMWVLVTALESRFRVGLYDVPFLPSQEMRRDRVNAFWQCEVLPCASAHTSFSQDFVAILVFGVCFATSRGFAESLFKERDTMNQTISIVETVATLLAGYDVDTVASLLDENRGKLPADMYEALRMLEQNLRSYQPYLPAALFDRAAVVDSKVQRGVAVPPGGEEVAIMFTDIKSSTDIWESSHTAMRTALSLHNEVVRALAAEFCGYEVKTIGDSFMLAFHSLAEGAHCALRMHEDLLAVEWPAALLEIPICRRRHALWGGLTLRIGLNSGPVTAEQNTLTGRMDYFGHTVNVASRLESVCTPGALAMLQSDWEAVNSVICPSHADMAMMVSLKGVSEELLVNNVWSAALHKRRYTTFAMQDFDTSTIMSQTTGTGSGCSIELRPNLAEQLEPVMTQATVGFAEFATVGKQAAEVMPLRSFSFGLERLSVSLDQSGGTLLSVLGSHVCVGWNLGRASPSHAEGAVNFLTRIQRFHDIKAWIGLASGLVQYGDVGTRTQRFLTVTGPTVSKSWWLCSTAQQSELAYLFAPPEGPLPKALTQTLQPYGDYFTMRQNTSETKASVEL